MSSWPFLFDFHSDCSLILCFFTLQTLRRSLLHVAEAAVDAARNLLLAAQHKSSSASSIQAVEDFLSACHSTQQACLKVPNTNKYSNMHSNIMKPFSILRNILDTSHLKFLCFIFFEVSIVNIFKNLIQRVF